MSDFDIRYSSIRRALIEREFARLNDMQQKAVFKTEGPLLLLAGAGSGKTTVLINRIINLLRFGRGYESEEAPAYAGEEELYRLAAALRALTRACVLASRPFGASREMYWYLEATYSAKEKPRSSCAAKRIARECPKAYTLYSRVRIRTLRSMGHAKPIWSVSLLVSSSMGTSQIPAVNIRAP